VWKTFSTVAICQRRDTHQIKYLSFPSPSGIFAREKIPFLFLLGSYSSKTKSCHGSLLYKGALPDPASPVLGANLVKGVTVRAAAETEVAQEADGNRRSGRWWRSPRVAAGAGTAGGDKARPGGSASSGCCTAQPPPPSLPLLVCQCEAARARADVRPIGWRRKGGCGTQAAAAVFRGAIAGTTSAHDKS
jgi:hypothetical protein